MYEELVKQLKDFAAELRKAEDGLLVRDAADAIEELSKRVDGSIPKGDAEIIIEELSKPRWIPVTERLPKKTNYYLVHVKCECNGELVGAWEEIAWFYEKFYWKRRHSNDVINDVFKETVTHWMPLPAPPKEE